MAEVMLTDLKALLLEREDCDAGTVQKIREALTQGKSQCRSLQEVATAIKKKLETAANNPAVGKRWHLKLGIVSFFLGHLRDAVEHLKQAEGALANFYLGRALVERRDFDEALKAFDKAEKAGYTAAQVQLQRAGIFRQQGDLKQARALLHKLEEQATHNAEYHFQLAACLLAEGRRGEAVNHLERAVALDPGHTGALFELGYANDLAGNDEEAISYYERCLNYPPIHVGVLMNLGVLYEDTDQYDKAVDCYRRILGAIPAEARVGQPRPGEGEEVHVYRDADERARLFLRDAQASKTMYYSPEEEAAGPFGQVLEMSVNDFELSVRARNCLKKMNIKTLGDLTRVSEQQLLGSKNFGETSLEEIKEMLASKGLRLGQSIQEGGASERRFAPAQVMTEEEQALLSKPIADLNLTVRARKCMLRLGINTVGDLVQRTADELLEAKNFGMTSLNEVREKLRQLGLSLRGD
jgi:DNA-directed RNA polymerase subunit alpha